MSSAPARRAQITLGATTVTYLPDGFAELDPAKLFPAADWTAHPGHVDNGKLVLSLGSFLIRTAGRNILVDLGAGAVDLDHPTLGRLKSGALLEHLAGEGLSRDDVDTVVYTHLHRDHIGWTTGVSPFAGTPARNAANALTFHRAQHLLSEAEWRHWTEDPEPGGPSPELILGPLKAAIRFVDDGETIAPGVRVLATPGHTPGHLAIAVEDPSGQATESVLIVGDVLHSAAQISDSGMTFATDVDPARARTARDRVLARPDTVLAAGHFTGTVFGNVVGDGHTWARCC
ncbi:MBL fold metallo-hydrolase [Amycolatopsis sp. WQ 127309]|uniref:MBL fold metallo-hydrolase n=1 Tax=Amycolatopsis sp. WQ 127309 TaxID=2932773 RepID=UPI001FF5E627|nr:MBL fold metallo-hydrolase [Amycolatopsis sp. WQ 127309]UOZ03450.1 MBL fold metallo-hydrolase [Amycolatopsis sp. WQ 127309]